MQIESEGTAEVVTLVNTLHYILAEVEAEKRGDSLRALQAKALADTVADSLAEVKNGEVGKTLKDEKGASLV